MPNLSKETLAAMLERARADGYTHGHAKGMLAGEQMAGAKHSSREAAVKLINAVGQTLDTQARLVQGLANALDNMPR